MKRIIFLLVLILPTIICAGQSFQNGKFYNTDDGNKMYYEYYGSGKSAIVFIHGWSVTCRSWDDQIDFFKDKFKVILLDLPGFGKSEHKRQDWSMQHYGKDVAGLCRELKLENVYLVGWSMGTAVVVEAASLIGNNARAVILVDQLHQTEYVYDSTNMENWYNRQVSKYKDFNAWYKSYHNDSTLAAKYLSMMPLEDQIPEWWKPSVVSFFKWQDDYLKERVSELKIPIRAINASNMITDEGQWKSFYKDYKLTVFENSTHMLVWEYPQKFNETLLQIITEVSDSQ